MHWYAKPGHPTGQNELALGAQSVSPRSGTPLKVHAGALSVTTAVSALAPASEPAASAAFASAAGVASCAMASAPAAASEGPSASASATCASVAASRDVVVASTALQAATVRAPTSAANDDRVTRKAYAQHVPRATSAPNRKVP